MKDIETRLQEAEARGVAQGIALRLLLTAASDAVRRQVATAAAQVLEQGQAHAATDAHLARVSAALLSLIETD